MKKSVAVLLVLGLLVLIVGLGIVRGYNSLVDLETSVDSGWAEVENQLQRRADLIYNLMETVKGYAAHEERVFTEIADARSRLLAAQSPTDQMDANNSLDSALGRLLRNDVLILDELGYVQFDTTGSDHLFQLISKAYEHRSLIVTSNLDFQDWGRLFDQPATAAAFLDRLLHHAHVIALRGESYRIRHRLTPPAAPTSR